MATDESCPPDYDSLDHGITRQRTVAELLQDQQSSLYKAYLLQTQARCFVRSAGGPSSWRLLTGPSLSNASDTTNDKPARKCRYRVIHPPGYEDIYLHKSVWKAGAVDFPRYHVELFGNDRYEPEPIVILGPFDHDNRLTNEAKNIAIALLPTVFSKIEDRVIHTSRSANLCESEYYSWDWRCKTNAARNEMRKLIQKAKQDCLKCARLAFRLEQFLDFVWTHDESQDYHLRLIGGFRRMIGEASTKLDKMWL